MRGRLSLLFVTLAALAAGVLVGWYLRAPGPGTVVAPQPQPSGSPPGVGIHKAGLVVRHKGHKQAELNAERVEVTRDTRYARFKGIPRATLFHQGQPALHLRADEIVFDRQTDDLIVRGDIRITSTRGDSLRAPEARWVASGQRLIFPRGTALQIGGNEVRARRLTVDLALQTLELEGDVEISFVWKRGVP